MNFAKTLVVGLVSFVGAEGAEAGPNQAKRVRAGVPRAEAINRRASSPKPRSSSRATGNRRWSTTAGAGLRHPPRRAIGGAPGPGRRAVET